MRKYKKRMLAGCVAVLLCGCSARELEDRKFVQALELNLREGQLVGGFGDSLESGETVGQIRDACQSGLDQYLDLGHIQVIILGTDLLADRERTKKVLLELEQMPLISRSSLVFTHTYEADESYLAKLKDEKKEPGEYLANRYENAPGRRTGTTLGDLLDDL